LSYWEQPQGGNDSVARIRAVFFDVGETIVDESREYGAWADWLEVPRHTFSAVFGAVVAAGRHHRETFECFKRGFDLPAERAARAAAGQPERYGVADLYPDAGPCLAALRGMGMRIGLAGNQTKESEAILHSLDLAVDVIGTSEGWGLEKPSPDFFARVVDEAGCAAPSVLYVGDRLDNDIRPAQEAGLATCFVRRGPWGHLLREAETEERCLFQMDDLASLPALLDQHNNAGG
jgi:HAD superfamily hydrolase (TIGR01549 family)